MIEEKKGFATLAPYVAGMPVSEVAREYGLEEIVKLASNENPLGTSPHVTKTLLACVGNAAEYPDGGCFELRQALAEQLGIGPEWLVFGTGSDGLIELIGKTFLQDGDNAVMSEKTFSLYYTNTVAFGAEPKVIPLNCHETFDLPSIARAIDERTKVVWLCNPNNPTGTVYSKQEQEAFLEQAPEDALVVIDEAYYEFAKEDFSDYPDSLSEVKKRQNVIVLRTFSKIYGLAGLRVGYGIGNPKLVAQMEKVRPPFNVNLFAQKASCAALEDQEFVRTTLRENRKNLMFLRAELERMGLRVLESFTNFVMVDTGRDSRMLFERLLRRGVIVKAGAGFGMDTYLRVSVGTRGQCEKFLKALREVLDETEGKVVGS